MCQMKILELLIHLWPEALGSTHAQPYTAQVHNLLKASEQNSTAQKQLD